MTGRGAPGGGAATGAVVAGPRLPRLPMSRRLPAGGDARSPAVDPLRSSSVSRPSSSVRECMSARAARPQETPGRWRARRRCRYRCRTQTPRTLRRRAPRAGRHRATRRRKPETTRDARDMTPSLIERLAAVPEVWADARPWAISPDGTTLAFTWRRDGDWHVFSRACPTPSRAVSSIRRRLRGPSSRPTAPACTSPATTAARSASTCTAAISPPAALVNLLPDTPTRSPRLPTSRLSPDGRTLALALNHGRADGGGDAGRAGRRREALQPPDRPLVQRLVALVFARRRLLAFRATPTARIRRLHRRSRRRRAADDRRRGA